MLTNTQNRIDQVMEIEFDCDCGETVSHTTRGGSETNLTYVCDNCERMYAVTITTLTESNTR
jgi:transcription elongation factor Elf1